MSKLSFWQKLFGSKHTAQPQRISTSESQDAADLTQMNPLQLAGILASGQPSTAQSAAKAVWAGDDWNLQLTINILASKGAAPSGIPHEAGKRGAEILRDTCPPDRKEAFQKIALEAFGPATAGVSVSSNSDRVTTLKEKKSQRMLLEIPKTSKPTQPAQKRQH